MSMVTSVSINLAGSGAAQPMGHKLRTVPSGALSLFDMEAHVDMARHFLTLRPAAQHGCRLMADTRTVDIDGRDRRTGLHRKGEAAEADHSDVIRHPEAMRLRFDNQAQSEPVRSAEHHIGAGIAAAQIGKGTAALAKTGRRGNYHLLGFGAAKFEPARQKTVAPRA